jgi:hypothetical protein
MKARDKAGGFKCAVSKVVAALQDNHVDAASFDFKVDLFTYTMGELSRGEQLE